MRCVDLYLTIPAVCRGSVYTGLLQLEGLGSSLSATVGCVWWWWGCRVVLGETAFGAVCVRWGELRFIPVRCQEGVGGEYLVFLSSQGAAQEGLQLLRELPVQAQLHARHRSGFSLCRKSQRLCRKCNWEPL